MRRYLPSTIHGYLDLPSPQRIHTHNTQRYNTTPPCQNMDQVTPISPTPATQTQTHVPHSTCSYRIGKAQTQSSHPLTPTLPTPPRAKHIHISHTPPTPLTPCIKLISSTSSAVDTKPEPRVHPYTHTPHSPQPHISQAAHQHCRYHLTLCQHPHKQHKYHIHNNHRIHMGTKITSQTDQRRPHNYRHHTSTQTQLGLAYLTNMYNISLNNIMPHTWKLANIIPIPKPQLRTNKCPLLHI